MKTNPIISKLLGNKTVLYIVSAISLLNVIGYFFYGNINAVIYFAILGLLVSYFSKNMIIILLVPLVLVNIFVGSQQNTKKMLEGMTTTDASGNDPSQTTDPSLNNVSSTTNASTSTSPSPSTSSSTTLTSSSASATPAPSTQTESYRNKGKKGKYNVDYETTISEAYDNLNSILGSDGIKSLTTDTKRLMQQQQDLAKSMKDIVPLVQSFEPMMNQAKGLLESMGGIDSIKGLDGVKDMLSNIGKTSQ
jgi:hypothetical protein